MATSTNSVNAIPTEKTDNRWIIAQLGAREHYVIPRTLHQRGRLAALLTDAWVPPQHLLRYLPGLQSLKDRYHPALQTAQVQSATMSLLTFEAQARLKGWEGWTRMIRRNRWFEQHVTRMLDSIWEAHTREPVVFSYSYAAHDLFTEAKKRGVFCVLGQIDAGPHEEDLVAAEHKRQSVYSHDQVRAPAPYWKRWREECAMADLIVVNSAWSKEALSESGIAGDRVQVVPLAYEAPQTAPVSSYPDSFSEERPLRVLYLGTLTLRKGLARLVEAAQHIQDMPVKITVVGGGALSVPDSARNAPNIEWVGRVPRSDVNRHYRDSDIFLFPTLSDGFGLTQLEAMSQGLPVIASERCGDVVEHNENGWRLPAPTPEAIADALRLCLSEPMRLARWSRQARSTVADYHPERVIDRLEDVVRDAKEGDNPSGLGT